MTSPTTTPTVPMQASRTSISRRSTRVCTATSSDVRCIASILVILSGARATVLRAALASTLVAASAACTSPPESASERVAAPPESASQRVAAVPEGLRSAGTASMAITRSLAASAAGQGAELVTRGCGQVDFDVGRVRVVEPVGGEAGDGAGEATEFVSDGARSFLRTGGSDCSGDSGKGSWTESDLSGPDGQEAAGQYGRVVVDPTQLLAYLPFADAPVERVGDETVDGAPTTRYRLTVDLVQAAGRATGVERERLVLQASKVDLGAVPMDLWLDDRGRLRRHTYTHELESGSSPPFPSLTTTVEYADFGTDVDISLPDPSDVE